MNNRCICCTVRGNLVRIIAGLMRRSRAFDGIVVETTGLADRAPVAQMFFVDEDVRRMTKLDAIITVTNAQHLLKQIDRAPEAQEQLAFADVVLVNKVDLVDAGGLTAVERRIRNHQSVCDDSQNGALWYRSRPGIETSGDWRDVGAVTRLRAFVPALLYGVRSPSHFAAIRQCACSRPCNDRDAYRARPGHAGRYGRDHAASHFCQSAAEARRSQRCAAALRFHRHPGNRCARGVGECPDVGILLVFSLMVGPPATAQQLVTGLWSGILLSGSIALAEARVGIALAYHTDGPVSFCISMLSAVPYLASRGWLPRRSPAPRAIVAKEEKPWPH